MMENINDMLMSLPTFVCQVVHGKNNPVKYIEVTE